MTLATISQWGGQVRFDYVLDALGATSESRSECERLLRELDEALPQEISIVGNASSLLQQHHGSAIDELPTLRFNNAQIIDPGAQGARWDFVATSNGRVLEYYQENEPRYHHLIFTPYLDSHKSAIQLIGSRRPVLTVPLRLSRELSLRLLARPTTGIQILTVLDRLGRKVRLFGFDWKATPTFYDPSRLKDPHNHARERRVALEMIERNGWLRKT